jgi:ribosomal protein S18 acetylase RimI-like enzyme
MSVDMRPSLSTRRWHADGVTPDLELHLDSLVRSWEALAAPHAGCRVERGDGFAAAVFPGIPVFDNAVVLAPTAIDAALAPYEDRPVALWSADDEMDAALAAAGFEPDERSTAMLLDLDAPAEAVPRAPSLPGAATVQRVAELNGVDPSLFVGVPGAHAFADSDGVAVALIIDTGDTANVSMVATDERYRRQGRARAVLAHALDDARRRGLDVASLHATDEAVELYRGLGFRTVGRWQEWRRPGEG